MTVLRRSHCVVLLLLLLVTSCAGPRARGVADEAQPQGTRLSPFLMFEGRAAEAMAAYVAAFEDGRVITDVRFAAGEGGPEGTVREGMVELGGMRVRFFDSPAPHGFTFTPSMSLFVTCDSAAEVDRLAGELSPDGTFLMPLDTYPFARRFCWFEDRFGVSWQLIFV